MSSVLPWFLVAFATILLACALLAFWQSVRAALGLADLTEVENEGDEDERRALLLEKEALLANLRDLAFDHEAGKLSDDDFQKLDAKLRAKARGVLRKLDADVAGTRAKAEALVAARFATEGLAYEAIGAAETGASEADATGASEADATADSSAERARPKAAAIGIATATTESLVACTACGVRNDDDASFCKKCGAKLVRQGAEA